MLSRSGPQTEPYKTSYSRCVQSAPVRLRGTALRQALRNSLGKGHLAIAIILGGGVDQFTVIYQDSFIAKTSRSCNGPAITLKGKQVMKEN